MNLDKIIATTSRITAARPSRIRHRPLAADIDEIAALGPELAPLSAEALLKQIHVLRQEYRNRSDRAKVLAYTLAVVREEAKQDRRDPKIAAAIFELIETVAEPADTNRIGLMIARVYALAPELTPLSNQELATRSAALKAGLTKGGKVPDDVLAQGLAILRQAVQRASEDAVASKLLGEAFDTVDSLLTAWLNKSRSALTLSIRQFVSAAKQIIDRASDSKLIQKMSVNPERKLEKRKDSNL